MKVSRTGAAIALMSMALPPAAQAGETVKSSGQLVAASGGVYIARNGKLAAASSGQSIYKGDRIVTRADAKAEVALDGCSFSMTPASILAVDGGCAAPKTMQPSATGYQGANALNGVTWIFAALALGAIIATAVIATDDDSKPASP